MLETNYREVVRQVAKLDSGLKKNMNRELRLVAGEGVVAARARAGWSQTIPQAIVPTVTATGAGVRVKKTVPIAVLNERKAGFWRHPVFGNRDVWVTQRARASVTPVMLAEAVRLKKLSESVLVETARQAGFK